jgi:5-methylcytosine-specific restriction endonuclease McrA
MVARGWCSTHYARWRSTGSTEDRAPAVTCSVEGCTEAPRSRYAELCEKHYCRLRRTGSTEDPVRVSGECQEEGCNARATSKKGLCRKHYLRLRNRGSASFEFKGSNVPGWTGEEATYMAVHQRLRKQRGSASAHPCVDCGVNARQWSYNHKHPAQQIDVSTGLTYAVDLTAYEPRCASCHKKFDLAQPGGMDKLHRADTTSLEAMLPQIRAGLITIRTASRLAGCSTSTTTKFAWRDTKNRVFARDGYSCVRCGTAYNLDAHHRIPRGMGGVGTKVSFGLANVITLCRTHHEEVESKRTWAAVHGWLVARGQRPEQIPVETHRGWVRLDDDGGSALLTDAGEVEHVHPHG